MARYKFSVFHLHLTDDQGWRFESRKFPSLTKIGSERSSSPLHWSRSEFDNISYGPYFYTQDELRELVSFAAAREITIVPEIEMPGHALSALSAFPELSCTGGPFIPMTKWGIDSNTYCPGNDKALRFLEEVLDEVITIFDSPYIHCGGDEASHEHWNGCPKCQERMRAANLSTTDELQSWFIAHFAKYLAGKGKRLIGWDEILQGGLPSGTTVMSWRGTAGGIAAANSGHDVVMTPRQHAYLDYRQFGGEDRYEYIGGLVSLHDIYAYNPTDGIDEGSKRCVIGVQGNLWSEYVWGNEDLEWKLFPRIAAMAEIGWTLSDHLSWSSFLTRLSKTEADRLDNLGFHHAPIAIGLTATWNPGEIPTEWVPMRWPISGSIGLPRRYEVAFVFESGRHALLIRDVKLFIGGVEIGADDHLGTAFDPPSDSTFSFNISESASQKAYLTAEVSCDGGTDSSGRIYVYPA
jgi:hexosaminidase